MNIFFKTRKLEKQLTDPSIRRQLHGSRRAKLIQQRLDDMDAAPTLDTFRYLPQARCHELRENRKNQLSVDLDHPYRLIFEPLGDDIRKPDGGLDWRKIDEVRILGVEDTHE